MDNNASAGILIGGHRGVGENLSDSQGAVFPAFRENTIRSFQRAADLGVSFVEFDVQVTKDGVPVLWHDDDVVYGSPDQPRVCEVKDLTLTEFQELCGGSPTAASAGDHVFTSLGPNTTTTSNGTFSGSGSAAGASPRPFNFLLDTASSSGSAPASPSARQLLRKFRDKATHQHAPRAAPWDCPQDDSLPTLEAVFRAIPESVGFNIEVKMTTGDDVVHSPALEIDRVVSATLRVVSRCASAAGARRRVFLSSFDPDVCAELKRRGCAFPVYYLSGCGLYTHSDERRTSIPAALDFASANDLGGVVLPASVLIANKHMVADAKVKELQVMTYGLENDDLDMVQEQGRLGVTAAIIDDVEKAMRRQPVHAAA